MGNLEHKPQERFVSFLSASCLYSLGLGGGAEGVVFGLFLARFFEAEGFFDFFRGLLAGSTSEASSFHGDCACGINSDFNGSVHSSISVAKVAAA